VLSPEARVRAVVTAITGGAPQPGELTGLSDEEIRQVEEDQPAPLAASYRTFLRLIGGGAGRFMLGTDVYYPSILGLGTAARELLAENGSPFELKDSDRVFSMHQGYQFDVMRGPGADPRVWSFVEGPNGAPPLPDRTRFTDWLRTRAESEIPAWLRAGEERKGPGHTTGPLLL
jgi:hypothetical protein